MAELCCMSKLSLPMDGFERISQQVLPGKTLSLFDNGLDMSPIAEMQARGIILCFSYPALNSSGASLNDSDKSTILRVYNASNATIDMPVHKSFILLGNPITSDETNILNRMLVDNTGDFTLGVEGLILLVNKDGVKLDANASCNC